MSRDDEPIEINSPAAIAGMRRAGIMAAALLQVVGKWVRPGISTLQINQVAEKWTRDHGGISAPLGYRGFPKSMCTSINEVVCHGIPSAKEVLREGDIVNLDVTPKLDGFHGDTSATFIVGTKVRPEVRKLVETTRLALDRGLAEVGPGKHIGDIGAAIQEFVEPLGFSVVREYCGHGIHRIFHCAPNVPHYGTRGAGAKMRPGMTFTVEPMINAGGWKTKLMKDRWTAVTADGSLSAQFEHTILVTDTGADVLTAAALVTGSEFDPGDLRGTPYDPDRA